LIKGGDAVTGAKGRSHYASLREKNLVNAQMSLLRKRFDFGRESWLAERLVADFNAQMETYEAKAGVRRVQPGRVKVSFREQEVILPLLTPEGAADLVSGKRCLEVLRRMQQQALSTLQAVDPRATMQDVYRLAAQRELLPKHGGPKGTRSHPDVRRTPENAPQGEINPNLLGCHPLVRTDVEGFVPTDVKDCLLRFMCREEKFSPARALVLLEELALLRERYYPLASALQPGQAVWIGIACGDRQQEERLTTFRQQVPVIVTLHTPQELEAFNQSDLNLAKANRIYQQMIARMTTEAYLQSALLSTIDLGFLVMRPQRIVADLITAYEQEHDLVLPTPGSVHDAGRKMTHKRRIIQLHLQGMLNQEIARIMHHSPEAIDRYVADFHATLILYLYDVPPGLAARVMRRGLGLVREHLALVHENFPDKNAIKEHLRRYEAKLF